MMGARHALCAQPTEPLANGRMPCYPHKVALDSVRSAFQASSTNHRRERRSSARRRSAVAAAPPAQKAKHKMGCGVSQRSRLSSHVPRTRAVAPVGRHLTVHECQQCSLRASARAVPPLAASRVGLIHEIGRRRRNQAGLRARVRLSSKLQNSTPLAGSPDTSVEKA